MMCVCYKMRVETVDAELMAIPIALETCLKLRLIVA